MNKSTLLHIFPLLLLFLCHQSPLRAQGIEKEGERFTAYEFSRKMGRGANFMAAKIEGRFHSNHDFKLLADNHFTHCRIGGKLNLHMGAAPDFVIDADRIADLKEAADLCIANGLIAIIDPLHLYNEYYSDDELPAIKKIWTQVAKAFADYSVDQLAFEIMNEPHNGNALRAMIHASLSEVRKVKGNEERIVIVSGQGFTTRQALINAFDNHIFPVDDNYLIGTFHYYDPKSFTKQGTFGVTTQWGESGTHDSDWSVVEEAFDEVVDANDNWAERNQTNALPIYLGEYGVDNQAPRADRKRWLCWIRMQAEKRGFSIALWNMYSLTSKGIGPWTREQKDDPATRYLEEDMVEVLMTRYEMESSEYTGGIEVAETIDGFSGEGYVDYSDAMKGDYVSLNSIYIPRTDTYDVTFRYKNTSSDDAQVDIEVYDSNMNLISKKKEVHFLGAGQDTGWHKLVLELEFAGDPQSIIGLKSSDANMPLVIDYFSVSMGEYHDLLYPAKMAVADISTGIDEPIGALDDLIKVYPRVFSDYTTVYSSLNHDERVYYKLNDMIGRVMASGKLNASRNRLDIGDDLSRGVYILQFWTEGKRKSLKLVKTS